MWRSALPGQLFGPGGVFLAAVAESLVGAHDETAQPKQGAGGARGAFGHDLGLGFRV